MALLARGEEGLEGASKEVERRGGSALAIPTDVSSYREVDEAASEAESQLGEIGVWVNDAMTTVFSPFMEYQPEEYARVTEVTYLGTVWGTQVALQRMLPRDRGVIIQVGSALAYRGIPYQSAYCGAKHAMKGFTESVRSELLHRKSGVHVGMVQLPAVNTPQFSHCRSNYERHPQPVPPIYQPEVAADAVHLAVRERRREIYVGFPTWKAIVGNKVSSALLDHLLARKGVEPQLADRPPSPHNDEGNLFKPVAGDPGPYGIFGPRSRRTSPLLWLNENRVGAGAAALGAVVAGFLTLRD
jgi:short-subunit dehydrogenase